MESLNQSIGTNYNSVSGNVQEVRVDAESLATSFPESTRFDTPPNSILASKKRTTLASSESAFFPQQNTPTLEPIKEEAQTDFTRQQEEQRIHKNMRELMNKKLRAEQPLFKQQKLEEYNDQLTAALQQRDEYIKQINISYRNLQRTYTNRLRDCNHKIAALEKKDTAKTTIIKTLCGLLCFAVIIPVFFKSNQKQPILPNQTHVTKDFKEIGNQKTRQYYYTAQPNDTITSVSQKIYGDKRYAAEIKKNNNLNTNKLKPGTKILITEVELD